MLEKCIPGLSIVVLRESKAIRPAERSYQRVLRVCSAMPPMDDKPKELPQRTGRSTNEHKYRPVLALSTPILRRVRAIEGPVRL